MSNMKKFMIREQAQKSTRVHLVDPATSAITEDWVDVRSSLSDEFIDARNLLAGEASEWNPDKEARKRESKERQLRLKAALVAGWSFHEECNEENVVTFLREAPQVGEMLLNVADDGSRFFAGPSTGSASGQKPK